MVPTSAGVVQAAWISGKIEKGNPPPKQVQLKLDPLVETILGWDTDDLTTRCDKKIRTSPWEFQHGN